MLNRVALFNTGFYYTICGTESDGFKLRVMDRYVGKYASLEEAHERILKCLAVYMSKGVRV